MQDYIRRASVVITTLGFLLLAGCASVSVKDQEVNNLPGGRLKPTKIYVRDFDLPLDTLNVDRSGAELEAFKKQSIESMSAALLAEIVKFYPVEKLAANAPAPVGNYLVLDGQFLRVNQGSRALRMFIGFGAGGTKMETAISLYDAGGSPMQKLLAFDTTGGSGAEPGVVGDPTPVGAAGSMAGGSMRGISEDTKRTARMIAYRLSQYLGDRGWITPDQVKAAKKQGE